MAKLRNLSTPLSFTLFTVAGCLCLAGVARARTDLPLLPIPESVAVSERSLELTGVLSAHVNGCPAAMTKSAILRFDKDLRTIAGHHLSGPASDLSISCLKSDDKLLSLEVKEGYRLTVSSNGVVIDADGETGVLRALATLRQLIRANGSSVEIPYVRITDRPRFPWRGLMVDVARHFMSLEKLERQASGGEFYTLDQIRQLVQYAAARGLLGVTPVKSIIRQWQRGCLTRRPRKPIVSWTAFLARWRDSFRTDSFTSVATRSLRRHGKEVPRSRH